MLFYIINIYLKKVRGMKIGQILRENQRKEYKQIRGHKKKKTCDEGNLSFEEVKI